MSKKDPQQALSDFYQALIRARIQPARVRLAWKQTGGSYLYREGDKEAQLLTEIELYEKESLMADLFLMKPEINLVLRALPPNAEALAMVSNLRSLRPSLDDAAQIIGTRIVLSSEDRPGRTLSVLKKKNACLVKSSKDNPKASPYVLAVGRDLDQVLAASLIMDKSALAYVEGSLIGGARPLSFLKTLLYRLIYLKLYQKQDVRIVSQTAEDIPRAIPEEEMGLRLAMLEIGRQLMEENLVQGTWGNLSVRLDDRHMLVTPSGLAYDRLTPYDIVRVDMETLSYEGRIKPTSESRLHASLYRGRPDRCWIIHSHAVQSSVFAACQKAIPVIHDQDRAFLGDMTAFSKRRLSGTGGLARAVTRALNKSQSGACVLGSHGILCTGASKEEALERCRATERAARRYLDMKVRELRG